MNKKAKTILSLCLLFNLFFSSVSTIYAEELGEYTEDTSTDVLINLSVPSTFNVKIPKKIILNGTTKEGHYKVYVKGDISGNKEIVVEPEESIVLTQLGKEDGTATVVQDKVCWGATDINKSNYIESEGVITASNISAGKWKSELKFFIGLDTLSTPGLYDENGTLLYTWEELLSENILTISDTTLSSSFAKRNEVSGELVIDNTITAIGNWSFSEAANLTSVNIPASVTNLGETPFQYCSSLENIEVSLRNPTFKSQDNVIFTKNMKSLLLCAPGKTGDYIIPEGTEVISRLAFYTCMDLTSIAIPDGVTIIGHNAFDRCTSITEFTIPASVAEIHSYVFNACSSLENIYIDDANAVYRDIDGVLIGPSNNLCWYPSGRTAESYEIPSEITLIEADAFSQNGKLTKITLPDNIKEIRYNGINGGNVATVVYKGTEYTDPAELKAILNDNQVIVHDQYWN